MQHKRTARQEGSGNESLYSPAKNQLHATKGEHKQIAKNSERFRTVEKGAHP